MSGEDFGGSACCILDICCGGTKQIDALAKKIHEGVDGINKREAERVAEKIIQWYDLAPAGTLREFKRAIAALAREYPPEPGY